ncbi:hypothetical protein PRZ48_010252 [Zasmidium cellare]|uniref:Uncharacterized protein n=1 Tax=Zasmidium cellare TaxID=395010 RepID=A0ABR0E842_ZASCE|nr:hypothetical protein PRZ48_010252 [Zasmidium cellare]
MGLDWTGRYVSVPLDRPGNVDSKHGTLCLIASISKYKFALGKAIAKATAAGIHESVELLKLHDHPVFGTLESSSPRGIQEQGEKIDNRSSTEMDEAMVDSGGKGTEVAVKAERDPWPEFWARVTSRREEGERREVVGGDGEEEARVMKVESDA